MEGDANCDGDNDLMDFALMQQCQGLEPDPVFPMEYELLDFIKDGQIDEQDVAGFVSVLDGP